MISFSFIVFILSDIIITMANKEGVGDNEVDPLANPSQSVKYIINKAATKRPLVQPPCNKDESPSAGSLSQDDLSKSSCSLALLRKRLGTC